MEPLVNLLKPLFVPLLKLSFKAPHLPEGVSLVRELKPQPAWLSLRYLAILARQASSLVALVVLVVLAVANPGRAGFWLTVAALAFGLFTFFTLGFQLVAARVDFDLRHYLVGDRSLRISHGALTRQEVTLSYANVQNIEVTQGPFERLFGIQSLVVTTAGGATDRPGHEGGHRAVLAGLTQANEVRQLMLSMLQQHKDAGLGDPERAHADYDAAALSEVRTAAVHLANVAESLVA